MSEKQNIRQLLSEYKAKLLSLETDCIIAGNFNGLVKSFKKLLISSSPEERGSKLKTFQYEFEEKYGAKERISLCQAVVFSLFCDNVEQIDHQELPNEIVEYVKEDFLRAVKMARQKKNKLLTVENPLFISYLEVLAFVRLPLGNQGVVIGGFSRDLIRLQPPLKMCLFLWSIFSCGGNYPLYELHYNPHRLREFNPEGWHKVMRLGAELLQSRPEVKGIFAGAWFYDPALKDISPELSYLRELVLGVGGTLFFAGRREQDRKNAFAISKVRRIAFEEGRYDPANYLAIISRKALLKSFQI